MIIVSDTTPIIVLYSEAQADLMLLDEHKVRSIAKQMDIEVVGTLGIMMTAYKNRIASAEEVEESIEFAAVLFLAIGFAGYRKEKQVPASRKAP